MPPRPSCWFSRWLSAPLHDVHAFPRAVDLTWIPYHRRLSNLAALLRDREGSDYGWNNVGWRNPEMRTPTIDALAKSGIILERHYGFMFCSPSRCAFLSGRLPIHVNQGQPQGVMATGGVDLHMTTIGEKMQAAQFYTAWFGKWHVGQRSVAQLPVNRGFNRSLGFLTGAENHFTQQVSDPTFGNTRDLWEDDHPAWGKNGSYGTYIYTNEAIATVNRFAPHLLGTPGRAQGQNATAAAVKGLFIYLAWQVTHSPLQVPTSYCYNSSTAADALGSALSSAMSRNCPSEGPNVKGHSFCYCYDNETARAVSASVVPTLSDVVDVGVHGNTTDGGDNMDRHTYNAMARIMDQGMANFTGAIRRLGVDGALWADTLIVFSADNGGPINAGQGAGCNWPLRGGKHTSFEGGSRLSAFVSGGYLPDHVRGTTNSANIHLADWWATFCALVSIDPVDARAAAANVPPVDSIDQWPILLTPNASQSARAEVPIAIVPDAGRTCRNASLGSAGDGNGMNSMNNCALIIGDWKLVTGEQNLLGFWQGPRYPNSSSTRVQLNTGCPFGCLFDLRHDKNEQHDCKAENPKIFASMMARLEELEGGVWSSNTTRGPDGAYTDCLNSTEYHNLWGGYRGPACFLDGQKPTAR